MFTTKKLAAATSRLNAKKSAPTLRIGQSNDDFEQQAELMADKVMSWGRGKKDWSFSPIGGTALMQRKCACGGAAGPSGKCEECKEKGALHRKAAGSFAPDIAPPIVHEVLASTGRPLDKASRNRFEQALGYDLSNVRIHVDARAAESAHAVNALAYTVGNKVVFGHGQFNPATREGGHLLAHELAHTVQQQGSPQSLRRKDEKDKKETKVRAPVDTENLPARDVDVRDWPNKLPHAKRKGPQQQIKKVRDELKLENTTLGGSELSAEQKLIVRQIKINRATDIKEPWPWMEIAGAYNRKIKVQKGKEIEEIKDPDRKGGYKYGGEGAKQAYEQPEYKDAKREELNKEFYREGASISAINTYDNVWLTLGRGLTGAFLSRAMEEFFQNDPKAREMFLDLGATFADGKLLVVNTDNGAIEEDQLVGNLPGMNARKIFAMSEPLLTLYKHVAESEVHAKFLQPAMHKQEEAAGLAVPQPIIDSWDIAAIKLAGHLILGAGLRWTSFEKCNGNGKEIMKVYARLAVGRDPKRGNARVVGIDYSTVILNMAGGKAKEAFDSVVDLPEKVPEDSQKGKLLLQRSANRFLQMSL